jgi:hypothetical protein
LGLAGSGVLAEEGAAGLSVDAYGQGECREENCGELHDCMRVLVIEDIKEG